MSGLVELGRYSDASLAHIHRSKLESAGIEAVCFDTGMNVAEGIPAMIRVRLMVLDEDLPAARQLLDERLVEAQDVFGDDVFDQEIFDAEDDEPSDLVHRRTRLLRWGVMLLAATFIAPLIVALVD
jgi:hypothetical protein